MDCPSGKRWFLRESDAVHRAQQDELEFGFRMKAYHCPECGWWHKARKRYNGQPALLLDWLQRKRG